MVKELRIFMLNIVITTLLFLSSFPLTGREKSDFCTKFDYLIQTALLDFDILISDQSVAKKGLIQVDSTLPYAFSTYIDVRLRQLNPTAPPKYVSFIQWERSVDGKMEGFTFDGFISKIINCMGNKTFDFVKKKKDHIEISFLMDSKTQITIVIETIKSPLFDPYIAFRLFRNVVRTHLITTTEEELRFKNCLDELLKASGKKFRKIKGKKFARKWYGTNNIFRSKIIIPNMTNERLVRNDDEKTLKFVSTYYQGEDSSLAMIHFNHLNEIMDTYDASGKIKYESLVLKEDNANYIIYKVDEILSIEQELWYYYTNFCIAFSKANNLYKVELIVYLT